MMMMPQLCRWSIWTKFGNVKPWRPSWSGILWFSFERAPGSDHLEQQVSAGAAFWKWKIWTHIILFWRCRRIWIRKKTRTWPEAKTAKSERSTHGRWPWWKWNLGLGKLVEHHININSLGQTRRFLPLLRHKCLIPWLYPDQVFVPKFCLRVFHLCRTPKLHYGDNEKRGRSANGCAGAVGFARTAQVNLFRRVRNWGQGCFSVPASASKRTLLCF